MTAKQPPFELMQLGPFARAHVLTTFGTEPMAKNAETEQLITQAWEARLASARERGQTLFPGKMCGFRGWTVDDGVLRIAFGPTDYREFVGTNVSHPEIAERFGEQFLANGTGVCSVLVTNDEQLVLQRRSMTVFEHPGMLHFCGGSLAPIAEGDGWRADPFETMTIEFEEELSLARESIIEISCLGIARDTHTRKPDILLLTRVDLAAAELLDRASDEHSELLAVANDPATLHAWIGEHWDEITPAGLACLVAHLACHFTAAMAATWVS